MSCFWTLQKRVSQADPHAAPCSMKEGTQGFGLCCQVGDYCVQDGICLNKVNKHLYGKQSGFYTAACTNETVGGSGCLNWCQNEHTPDITYQNGMWQCCGTINGTLECNSPVGAKFNAPPPAQLQAFAVVTAGAIPVSGTAADLVLSDPPSSSSSSSPPGSITPVAVGNCAGSPSLAVAVGVGAATAVILVLLFLGGFFFTRRHAALKLDGRPKSMSSHLSARELDGRGSILRFQRPIFSSNELPASQPEADHASESWTVRSRRSRNPMSPDVASLSSPDQVYLQDAAAMRWEELYK